MPMHQSPAAFADSMPQRESSMATHAAAWTPCSSGRERVWVRGGLARGCVAGRDDEAEITVERRRSRIAFDLVPEGT